MSKFARSLVLLAVVLCGYAAVAAPSVPTPDGGPIPCPPGRKCK